MKNWIYDETMSCVDSPRGCVEIEAATISHLLYTKSLNNNIEELSLKAKRSDQACHTQSHQNTSCVRLLWHKFLFVWFVCVFSFEPLNASQRSPDCIVVILKHKVFDCALPGVHVILPPKAKTLLVNFQQGELNLLSWWHRACCWPCHYILQYRQD